MSSHHQALDGYIQHPSDCHALYLIRQLLSRAIFTPATQHRLIDMTTFEGAYFVRAHTFGGNHEKKDFALTTLIALTVLPAAAQTLPSQPSKEEQKKAQEELERGRDGATAGLHDREHYVLAVR